MSNANTVIIQGLTSPTMTLQGSNIAGFQIVERVVSQSTPTSYSVQRAGADGAFATMGTSSGSTTSYTDSTVSSGTTYEYRSWRPITSALPLIPTLSA